MLLSQAGAAAAAETPESRSGHRTPIVLAQKDATRPVSFDIRPQPMAEALTKLGEQSGLTVIVETKVSKGLNANALSGQYTPDEALKKLLEPAGLKADYLDSKTVVVRLASETDSHDSHTTRAGHETSVLRLAQNTQSNDERSSSNDSRSESSGATGAPQSPSPEGARNDPSEARAQGLEEIVVTGSHIRGAAAAGSKLVVIDREAIDQSGHGRVQDVLATLTQNFQGVSETFSQTSSLNANAGTEVQLRGLGFGTTLTLVNGRRQAFGGLRGNFVDVSSIAASAIERIEILPEGASALYGSDAVGGVVNIILRKDFEGFETRARASTADGDANEQLFAQLWGTSWSSGRVLVGYQYNERELLPASARTYSAANYDFRPFGGTDLRTQGSNPGTITIAGRRYAIPPGQDGTNLTLAQLTPGTSNYTDNVTYRTLLPEQQMHSAFLSASQDINDQWELSVDARYATRDFETVLPQGAITLTIPVSNAFNRFGVPVSVAYDFSRDLGPSRSTGTTDTAFVSASLVGALPGSWELKVSAAHGEETNIFRRKNRLNSTSAVLNPFLASSNPAVALNVFGDGSYTNADTLDALRRNDFDRGTFTTSSANVMVDGPLFSLPAGSLRLALGADYRKERLTSRIIDITTNLGRRASRDISALFAELAVPVMGPRAGRSANTMELSLAGRYEDYEDFGTTFDPKVGLNLRPWNFLNVRGTWGTSFRAPSVTQSDPQFSSPSNFSRTVPDPLAQPANSQVQVLVLSGAAPGIHEETADVWTAGLDLTPPGIENLSLSFTYFDIAYEGRIQGPGSVATFLTQATQFAPVITRNPTPAQIDAICNGPDFFNPLCTGSFAAILDARTRNLSSVTTRGLDADLRYSLATSHGQWGFGVRGTYTIDYETKLLSTSPVFEFVDTVGNPLALRLIGNLSWSWGGWTAGTAVNYLGGYQDAAATPIREVDSWTTVDLNVGYRIAASSSWLGNTRFSLGALNVLDEEPPFVNRSDFFGYDTANASLLGRQVSIQVVKEW